ncbi:MAG: outer membrane protein assembly factor BamD [Desulfomonilia bacterium]|jgi:outer membrane protein assembly factor BamD
MKKVPFIIVSMVIIAIISSCAHEAEKKIKPAQELYDEAAALAKKGKVEKAADAFMQVRTYYPGHELARKSILETGNLYYDHEDYELALKNYEEFRLLYPTDLDAGYCLFRIGMCHYKQMSTFDRDQTETTKAIQSFEGFMKSYPDSPYGKDATNGLKEARTVLAKHYLYIGKFYLKKGNKKAACNRFQSVKQQYADTDLGEDIDILISKACTSSVPAPK